MNQSGQTATETLLVISVMVIALVGAAYTFIPWFNDGCRDLATSVSTSLMTGSLGGVGLNRRLGDGNVVQQPQELRVP